MSASTMVECEKCGVFNDVTLRDKCWKCQAALPKQRQLLETEKR